MAKKKEEKVKVKAKSKKAKSKKSRVLPRIPQIRGPEISGQEPEADFKHSYVIEDSDLDEVEKGAKVKTKTQREKEAREDYWYIG